MLFTRTQRFQSRLPRDQFMKELSGNHVKIHDMDFEVFEKGNSLRIIPHAENVDGIKTLPITHVAVEKRGNKTDVVVTSRMRALDSGGPLLVVAFCTFMLIASMVMLYVERAPQITYTLVGISLAIFGAFYVRMQMGYFDYVRKIMAYIRSRIEAQDMSHPILN